VIQEIALFLPCRIVVCVACIREDLEEKWKFINVNSLKKRILFFSGEKWLK